jgi:hypothetical protein
MTLTLNLHRDTLTNVDDPAGRWQYEGGTALENSKQVAHYASTKRVVFHATDAQNTAMLTVEIFFDGNNPPESMTLQGAHDFNSGGETGSVSAASSAFAPHIGKAFKRVGDVLTIQ